MDLNGLTGQLNMNRLYYYYLLCKHVVNASVYALFQTNYFIYYSAALFHTSCHYLSYMFVF